jgi:hypothetical protein
MMAAIMPPGCCGNCVAPRRGSHLAPFGRCRGRLGGCRYEVKCLADHKRGVWGVEILHTHAGPHFSVPRSP